ncbi:MAG: GIY-YIG nuclease family protein [Anaerolineales bacterium]
MSDYYCYILECSDGTLYTGWTTNPDRRLREHNAGRGAQYTRARRPLRLVYLEEHPTRTSAQQREYQIKRRNRRYKLRLIESLQDKNPLQAWKEDHNE